jgi:hypothetical protein
VWIWKDARIRIAYLDPDLRAWWEIGVCCRVEPLQQRLKRLACDAQERPIAITALVKVNTVVADMQSALCGTRYEVFV